MHDSSWPIPGGHDIIVSAGSKSHPSMSGIWGRIVFVQSNDVLQVRFDSAEEKVEVSPFDVVEYCGTDTATRAGPETHRLRIGIFFRTETGNIESAAESLRDRFSGCSISASQDIGSDPAAEE